MEKEGRDSGQGADEVRRFVEDHDDTRSQARSDRPRTFKRERHVQGVGAHEDTGGTAEEDCPDGAIPRHAPAQLEQLPQRRPELDLVPTGPGDMARKTEQLRSRRTLRARRGIARPTTHAIACTEDQQHVDHRLDVVDRGRLSEEPDLDGEWRLVAGLAALALDRLEERGFLAADVGAGAPAKLDVEGPAGPGHVDAEEPRRAGGLDGAGQA